MSFDELGLSAPLLRAVAAEGYTAPTPIQAQAIPHAIAGRDLLGCAQTGTGKTAAFALPVIHRLTQGGNPPKGRGRRIRVLVLSPTRELAAQIGDSFRVYGQHTALRHTVVFGGVGQNNQVRALRNGVDILVATPGRLEDLMEQGFINLDDVEIFVLDEADRMLDIGFMPAVRRVTKKLPAERQTLFFSATMPPAVEDLANSILRDPAVARVAPVKATTELIEQSVYFVPQRNKPELLTGLLATKTISRAIVFTRTKHGADRVTKQLNRAGVVADAIHGNKSQNARQRSLADFKANRTRVLVAADLAARGIDVDGVSHVVNFDLPQEAETYVHRIGRTGRAGATGAAITFCDHEEHAMLRAVERLTRKALVVEQQAPEGVSAGCLSPAPASDARGDRRDDRRGGNGSGRGQGGRRKFGRPSGSTGGKPHFNRFGSRPANPPAKKKRRPAGAR
ncbi:MAG: DEAD/DEAH box helicase [Pirellulales bacterium]